MKPKNLLTSALAAVALISTVSGAQMYLQPSIASMEVPGFEGSQTGGMVAVGATFAGKHSFDVEISQFSAEETWSDYFYSSSSKFKVTPVLLNYRYEFPISGKWFGQAGLSLGLVRQTLSSYYAYNYVYFGPTFGRFSQSEVAFAAGYHAGLGYRFTPHIAAILSAKALRSQESDLALTNTSSIISLGLNYRF